ncbi:hypothetical protein [Paenibacillus harenae]|uniref:hypothetical protein n=1 Tax=Paenibacillus harenae TaxID=306543 RepID=UPI0004155188|nr:hypothetical protein [Paenibacillus harenae]
MNCCTIENCTKPIKAKDLCAMHHQRLLRHGDPHMVRPRRVKKFSECKWVNCTKIAMTKGYCSKHYYIHRAAKPSQVNAT